MLKRMVGDKISNSGASNDVEFWESFSGITSESSLDHMVASLSALGYTGTPRDMLRQWLSSAGEGNGSEYDQANELFNNKTYLDGVMTEGLIISLYDDEADRIFDDT